ncbi:hypothetical protein QM716_15845 [Rhodococcus sp. IEGM 1409]|uniref:hypothetical protein n=1 Tax=Rhodococcus TaxID=1827 RepID=UPI0024B711AF|nr:hypothetical protein [Rhodococcus sp. IEGM 1409]MDI9901331.1 hypothetical protein [Rhodococcus sp. IEGM 1409]
MSHYITVRVELEDGTIAEKRTEIDRIGNPRFIAFETRQSAAVAVDEVVAMLTATQPKQIFPDQVSS